MNLLKGISAQVQQGPWQSMSGFGNGGQQVVINVNMNRGAVTLKHSGSTSDASQSARVLSNAIVKEITSERIHTAIARGLKM